MDFTVDAFRPIAGHLPKGVTAAVTLIILSIG